MLQGRNVDDCVLRNDFRGRGSGRSHRDINSAETLVEFARSVVCDR